MARYYFDLRDDGRFLRDDLGVELTDLDVVKTQAALGLMEHGRDVVPGTNRREIAVEVRTKDGPVLISTMIFEEIVLAS